jgi:DNA-binding beta-propeller fold protein YncE
MRNRAILVAVWAGMMWGQTAKDTSVEDTAVCQASAAEPSVTVQLPGNPFRAVVSRDGCWVFVSLGGRADTAGIAVLKRSGGTIELAHMAHASAAAGIVLTHDGKLLIAAENSGPRFFDVASLTAGTENPALGFIPTVRGTPVGGSVYVNVTADDERLFVSEESETWITVIDLKKARSGGYTADAIVGRIPTGLAPIALTFSPDGKWLYSTSEIGNDANWPPCGGARPSGVVEVIDVERARREPDKSVVAKTPAGCDAVRAAVSPKGDRLYVTSRASNQVVTFDTEKLRTDTEHALIRTTTVGTAPVPVAVVNGGKTVLAGNSNRFGGGGGPETLTVLDAAKIESGEDAAIGTIATGAFPREMDVSSDGRTLFLTNAASSSLQMIDLERLPVRQR